MPLQRAQLLLRLAGVKVACHMYTSCKACRQQCEPLGTPSCINHYRLMTRVPQQRRTPRAGGRGCNHLLFNRRTAGDFEACIGQRWRGAPFGMTFRPVSMSVQAAAAACCIRAGKLENQLEGVHASAVGMPTTLGLVLQAPAATCWQAGGHLSCKAWNKP